jgi:hypothetical protein
MSSNKNAAARLANGTRPKIVREIDEAPDWNQLPDAFEAADSAAQNLAELCGALYRVETAPERRVCLAPVSIATGEYRDRLYSLLARMERENRFQPSSVQRRGLSWP